MSKKIPLFTDYNVLFWESNLGMELKRLVTVTAYSIKSTFELKLIFHKKTINYWNFDAIRVEIQFSVLKYSCFWMKRKTQKTIREIEVAMEKNSKTVRSLRIF